MENLSPCFASKLGLVWNFREDPEGPRLLFLTYTELGAEAQRGEVTAQVSRWVRPKSCLTPSPRLPQAPGPCRIGIRGFSEVAPRSLPQPGPPPGAAAGPPLTVHVKLDGRLLAGGGGLVHTAAGEDAPDVQVCGVDEQLADGGLPLPVLQQLLGWDSGRAGQATPPSPRPGGPRRDGLALEGQGDFKRSCSPPHPCPSPSLSKYIDSNKINRLYFLETF